MPSTVASIFAAAGVTPAGVVRWGDPPALPVPPGETATGIYVVALTDRPDKLEGELAAAPLSDAALKGLLAVRPELTLDGDRPSQAQLGARLAAFWLPDEVVLYIGLAGPRRAGHGGGNSPSGCRSTTAHHWAPGARTPVAGR